MSNLPKTMNETMNHVPVLLSQSIDQLQLNGKSGFVIDATLGLGGHTSYILDNYPGIKVVGIDQDEDNLKEAKVRLSKYGDRVAFVHDNFSNIEEISKRLDVYGNVQGILMDLGIASVHVDIGERGFSFQKDGPLDMRMDKHGIKTAEQIINSYSEHDMSQIFRIYGEEPMHRKVARGICMQRKEKKIKTCHELVDIIKKAKKDSNKHPAKLIFQALRIEVNEELTTLEEALKTVDSILRPGARIVVISYHSLEDRIVKKAFRYMAAECICSKILPICQCKKSRTLDIITKKPIMCTESEQESNPRSRSAKMRVAEKI